MLGSFHYWRRRTRWKDWAGRTGDHSYFRAQVIIIKDMLVHRDGAFAYDFVPLVLAQDLVFTLRSCVYLYFTTCLSTSFSPN